MKNLYLCLFAIFQTISSCAQEPALKAQEKLPSELEKKLIWADEFDVDGLPNSSNWAYEEGYIRNNEKQYYTKTRQENVRVEKGSLIIESRKEAFNNFEYTSGSINTLGKKAFTGDFRIEVRAKLPQGKGIWPAIWMMGTNISTIGWPKCGELDIMEFVGHTPGTIFGTMHWADSSINYAYKSQGGKLNLNTLHDTFHVYGLERKGSNIKVFVDDQYYLDFNVPQTAYVGSFTAPVYLLLNTAVGGSWGGPIDDTIFPQKFEIDYVRAYQWTSPN